MKSTTQVIPLSAIEERENIRTTYDPVLLKQLSDSIVLHGQLQAIGVRAKVVDGKVVPGKYVTVFGHRRVRAHKLAGLKEIRAEVLDVADDASVTVLQDVENSQRVNLDVLERAAGHQKMKAEGKSLEEIAKATSSSEATVRDSLKLSELVGEVMTAFRDGKISFSHAVQIAKVPPTLQPELLKWALKPIYQYGKDFPSVRDLKTKVDNEYILDLKKAQFDTKDALLVPSAGACTTCVKRTGAQSQMFGEGLRADLCLDRPCNDAKTDATLVTLGAKVLPADEARDTFYPHGGIANDADYVLASDLNVEDPKRRPFIELVGGPGVAAKLEVVAKDPKGRIVKLFNKKAAAAAIKKAGLVAEAKKGQEKKSKARRNSAAPGSSPEAKAKAAERARADKLNTDVSDAKMGALVAAIEKEGVTAKTLRFIVAALVGGPLSPTGPFKRRGLKLRDSWKVSDNEFEKHFGKARAEQLLGLLLESLIDDLEDNYGEEESSGLLVSAGELLKVNLKKIEIDLREAEAAEQAKKSEGKDPKAAKKKAA